MSVKAKLIIDELEINILSFSFGFNQGSDTTGRVAQKPLFLGLQLKIETRKDLNLAEWAFALDETKQLELHIYPVILGGKTRKLFFYDCHLLGWENSFSSTGRQPLAESLNISAAGVVDSNSAAEYSSYWRTTFPNNGDEVTTLDEGIELIRFYITDLDDNEQDEYDTGDRIKLNIETKNAVGKKITLSLNDKTYDFKHNGIVLENDTLKDYVLNSDLEQIELEVIDQIN